MWHAFEYHDGARGMERSPQEPLAKSLLSLWQTQRFGKSQIRWYPNPLLIHSSNIELSECEGLTEPEWPGSVLTWYPTYMWHWVCKLFVDSEVTLCKNQTATIRVWGMKWTNIDLFSLPMIIRVKSYSSPILPTGVLDEVNKVTFTSFVLKLLAWFD